MTRKNAALWEQGINCAVVLSVAVSNFPLIPPAIRHPFSLFFILVLIAAMFFDHWKRASYSEKELERERRDERNQMIQMQAVWYCHLAEDWILLGAFAVFALFLQDDVIAHVAMWLLAARSLLCFAIRWWLSRKY